MFKRLTKSLIVLPRRIILLVINGYQTIISPLFGPCCRYTPTCSHFAAKAFRLHGVIAGSLLTVGRLLRCHPFSRCPRHDPVPEQFAWTNLIGYKHKTIDKRHAEPPQKTHVSRNDPTVRKTKN